MRSKCNHRPQTTSCSITNKYGSFFIMTTTHSTQDPSKQNRHTIQARSWPLFSRWAIKKKSYRKQTWINTRHETMHLCSQWNYWLTDMHINVKYTGCHTEWHTSTRNENLHHWRLTIQQEQCKVRHYSVLDIQRCLDNDLQNSYERPESLSQQMHSPKY